tara:strand:- start:1481 stop:1978 length:498 start_codon:yes stop_codon:yes gene_type:complete
MAAEQPMTPEEDAAKMEELKKLFDSADAAIAESGAETDPMPEGGDMMAEGAEMAEEGAMEQQEGEMAEGEAAEGVDLAPLMESIGATEERAQTLYNAAQQIPKLAGKTPQELADMIASDFDVLMQIEMVAARGEGGAMGGPTAEGMPPVGPEGMPPGEMMPPEGM